VVTLALCGCASAPKATFELDVPQSIATQSAWYEVGLFGHGCPAETLLQGGIPLQGTIDRLAFAAGTTSPPGVGTIPNGSYGLAAVARASDCSVIAAGCSTYQVSRGGTLSVSLSAVRGAPLGACGTGAACDHAACVPVADAGASSLGASCSLAIVGQGPLADPLNQDSTLLSPPAIAATSTGFLLAYREFDPMTAETRLTTIALDQNGGASPPRQSTIGSGCTSAPQTDAVGLAFSGGQGLVALAQPGCPASDGSGATSGGVELIAVDEAGSVGSSAFAQQGGDDMTLAPAHALAATSAGPVLSFTLPDKQESFAASISSLAFVPPVMALSTIDRVGPTTSALVVGTSFGTAAVVQGLSSADAGSGAALVVSVVSEENGDGGGQFQANGSPFTAQWVSAAGVGSRVLLASNGPSTDSPILWSARDMGSATATASGTFAPQSGGTVSFVDVAMSQDRAFFAAEVGDDISLFAFDKASTFPVQLREVPFSSLPVLSLGALRDGLVAVAASDTRVAVVWGTGKTIGSDDDVGGYAVFACTP
jgi:hypothetical protein